MRAAVLSLVALAALVSAQFTVNTPQNVAECEPLLISWVGGVAPFFPSVLPGGQPSAAPLVSFNQTSAQSLTWVVNEAVGTSLGITIRDSTGNLAQTAPFNVQSGQTTCLNQSVSVSNGPTSSGAPTVASSGSGASPTSGSSPSSTTGSSGSSSSGSSSSSSGAPSPSKSSGATSGALSDRVTQFGIAGAIAGVGMALLA